MEVYRKSSWLLLLLGVTLLATTLHGVQGEAEADGPSESECRPYIEKALKELQPEEVEAASPDDADISREDIPTVEITSDDSDRHDDGDGEDDKPQSAETDQAVADEPQEEEQTAEDQSDIQSKEEEKVDEESSETQTQTDEDQSTKSEESSPDETKESVETVDEDKPAGSTETTEDHEEEQAKSIESVEEPTEAASVEDQTVEEKADSVEESATASSVEETAAIAESVEEEIPETASIEEKPDESVEEPQAEEEQQASVEEAKEASTEEDTKQEESVEKQESVEDVAKSAEEVQEPEQDKSVEAVEKSSENATEETVDEKEKSEEDKAEGSKEEAETTNEDAVASAEDGSKSEESEEPSEPVPEEDLTLDIEIPENLRPRLHVEQLLKLDEESSESEKILNKAADVTLRELKKLYENAIKPLEVLYKYRDLSNRHFGDAEIFSKPLILFMGPWSGGKSSIINYLANNEYNETSLRTGAEPSPAYFNILMHGDEPEIIDGTELAADFTFSGLQKFGQGLEERLRGVKLPIKLLEKVNIVEIPGILEVRKQVSRLFPFNDACQWFIDRADIIFLVYDPSKLDVGPETEAILDQLKGREHQTRIILNKADQVKPEELMRVQGALIWNISPLMSSPQPPVMYTTSLWSRPYESWAPIRLLQAQERAFLRDLRTAVDKRIDNKIASARRFAVRVRNHAKMVDCYLTTYYNHKSVFGNRKHVADEIIERPQDYHIYEGLSTLTNISRYDLPDPEVYKDFFKLNALYEFQQLSATCTYFRGCPINRLDVAIAYDLPELVGTHKRLVEAALTDTTPSTGSAPPGS